MRNESMKNVILDRHRLMHHVGPAHCALTLLNLPSSLLPLDAWAKLQD
jgi:hypothetical protein